MELGPILDTFDYLADAAEFAGKSIGYTDLNRPPFLSLVTALFFLFGNLSITPIFIADGLLSIAGCIGLYLLMRERLSSVVSFVGSLLFATFPIVITYTAAGFNDVSSVGVAIWAIYLTYLAVEKNSKWFYLSFPVAMLAFLTRFNMALIIFPIFLYIFINWDKIRNRRDILIGISLSLLVILPFVIYLWMKFGNPLYTFMDFFGTSGARAGGGISEHFAYNPDPLYFLKNLPAYTGVQSVMVVLMAFLGFMVFLIKKWRETRKGRQLPNLNLKNNLKAKLALMVVLLIIFFFTFGKVHYFATELIFFVAAYLGYNLSKEVGIRDWRMDFLFFTWFMVFFIFQSIYVAKDHRYFITMAPPVAYFLVRGLTWAARQMRVCFKDKNLTLYLGAVILTLLMVFSAFSQLPGIEKDNENSKLFNHDSQQASAWLINYDPQYNSKIIYADLWSYFAWYLQMNVGKMPIFKNNETMYVGPKDYNFTKEDNIALNNELEKLRPDYYISAWKGMNFTSYVAIQRFGTVTIFKRVGG
ncbi:MAG: glycosyltransferase family 39 protein [Methanobacteriaceae archaeon]|nr:glycosyltransferase family 39 protein [Methanobacteriaceae archaeon]